MPKKKCKKPSFIAASVGGSPKQQRHGGKAWGAPYDPLDAFAELVEGADGGDRGCDGQAGIFGALTTKQALYKEDIFAVSPFLSAAECAACVAAAEQRGFEAATQFASKTHAFRDNDRMECQHPRLAEALWRRVGAFVPPVIDGRRAQGCNPSIRVYRYRVGQQFAAHIDGSVEVGVGGLRSAHTMLVYLNGGGDDELRGGETVFYKGTGKKQQEALSVIPARGMCLLHGHGHRCLLHAGAEVKRGVKYLLRTDVMYG